MSVLLILPHIMWYMGCWFHWCDCCTGVINILRLLLTQVFLVMMTMIVVVYTICNNVASVLTRGLTNVDSCNSHDVIDLVSMVHVVMLFR